MYAAETVMRSPSVTCVRYYRLSRNQRFEYDPTEYWYMRYLPTNDAGYAVQLSRYVLVLWQRTKSSSAIRSSAPTL